MENSVMRLIDIMEQTSPEMFAHLVNGTIVTGYTMLIFSFISLFPLWIIYAIGTVREWDTEGLRVIMFVASLLNLVSLIFISHGLMKILTPEAAVIEFIITYM